MTGCESTFGRCLLVLAVSFAVVMSGGRQALCVGGDGRVAIEPANPLFGCDPTGCESGHGPTADTVRAVRVCTDLLLAATTHVQPDRHDPVSTLRATTPMCYPDTSSTCAVFDRDPEAARRDRDGPIRKESTRSLRTTVLLL